MFRYIVRRRVQARRLAAATWFVESWIDLLPVLGDDYHCALSCTEANAASDMLRQFGHPVEAAHLLEVHAAHDVIGDDHYQGQPCARS